MLVTPHERVRIEVEDAPFRLVELDAKGAPGSDLRITFRTNHDEIIPLDADHPLRFVLAADGGLKPYCRVRGELEALASRAVALELAEFITEAPDGSGVLGLTVAGAFFPIPKGAPA
jgi:hypothetical protein